MALIKCKGCGHMISDRAEKCPKCGNSIHVSIRRESEKTYETVETSSVYNANDVIENGPKLDRKGTKKLLLTFTCIFAVIAVLVMYILSTSKKPETASDGSGENDPEVLAEIGEKKQSAENVAQEDESFYTITPRRVANIQIGKTFNDYNTSLMKQEEVAKQWFDFSIVDIKEEDSFEDKTYYMLMKIFKNDNLSFVLYGGYFETQPKSLQADIKGIAIYSPQFKLPNGIHVGMSAEELISNYGATISLCEGEGGDLIEYIRFDIPECEKYTFIADKEALVNVYGENYLRRWDDDGNGRSEAIEKAVIEYCSLAAITTYDFPIDFTDKGVHI